MLNNIYLKHPFKILLNIKILYNLLIDFKPSNKLPTLLKRLLILKPTFYKRLNFKIHFKML
jgi:hypothetical protein